MEMDFQRTMPDPRSQVRLARFKPTTLPAVTVLTADAKLRAELEEAHRSLIMPESVRDLAGRILDERPTIPVILYLNADNPTIQQMAQMAKAHISDSEAYQAATLAIYNNAIVLAHHLMTPHNAQALFTSSNHIITLMINQTERLALGETAAAEQAAREALALAQQMESPRVMSISYELLGRLQREAGQVVEAVVTATQRWRWARRSGVVESRYYALKDCARVRLLQARQACGLEPTRDDVPEQLPSTADRALALRHLRAARHFLRWAQPLATQLDRAAGNHTYQKELDELTQTADALTALLDQPLDP